MFDLLKICYDSRVLSFDMVSFMAFLVRFLGKIQSAIIMAIVAFLLSSCQSLPKIPHLPKSVALSLKSQQIQAQITANKILPTDNSISTSQFALTVGEQIGTHPSLSGYYPIATGANAFAARSILADMANHTIDAQYYIWHDDEAGKLMLKDLWEAAERGVIVRLLLDDMDSSPSRDELLLHFANHPNIAVRLINPSYHRKYRALSFITNPKTMNIRMHNKSMTFDNRISVVGGRNIGDEYLNNADSNQFADLDVLLVGAVVPDISASFNDFWNSPYAYDIQNLVKQQSEQIDEFSKSLAKKDINDKKNAKKNDQAIKTYRKAIATSTIGQDLLDKKVPFRWVVIRAYFDPATKLGGASNKQDLLVAKLRTQFGKPKNSLSIISSYFVPTKQGVDTLVKLAKDGVNIKILTNSYDATDVGAVHSGYVHWRKDLLKAGIRLYELKSTAQRATTDPDNNPKNKKETKLWRTKGQTTTSLHAKAFAIDDYQVFIGSYNIDPRSANINTEMGVVIEDELLAEHMHNAFNDKLLSQAYEVKLNNDKLTWHTTENGQTVVYDSEPNMAFNDRAVIFVMSLLPIDWLL